MANKSLSGLHDPYDASHQAQGKYEQGSPMYASAHPHTEQDALLDFYFGHPTSTQKSDPDTPHWSKW